MQKALAEPNKRRQQEMKKLVEYIERGMEASKQRRIEKFEIQLQLMEIARNGLRDRDNDEERYRAIRGQAQFAIGAAAEQIDENVKTLIGTF